MIATCSLAAVFAAGAVVRCPPAGSEGKVQLWRCDGEGSESLGAMACDSLDVLIRSVLLSGAISPSEHAQLPTLTARNHTQHHHNCTRHHTKLPQNATIPLHHTKHHTPNTTPYSTHHKPNFAPHHHTQLTTRRTLHTTRHTSLPHYLRPPNHTTKPQGTYHSHLTPLHTPHTALLQHSPFITHHTPHTTHNSPLIPHRTPQLPSPLTTHTIAPHAHQHTARRTPHQTKPHHTPHTTHPHTPHHTSSHTTSHTTHKHHTTTPHTTTTHHIHHTTYLSPRLTPPRTTRHRSVLSCLLSSTAANCCPAPPDRLGALSHTGDRSPRPRRPECARGGDAALDDRVVCCRRFCRCGHDARLAATGSRAGSPDEKSGEQTLSPGARLGRPRRRAYRHFSAAHHACAHSRPQDRRVSNPSIRPPLPC